MFNQLKALNELLQKRLIHHLHFYSLFTKKKYFVQKISLIFLIAIDAFDNQKKILPQLTEIDDDFSETLFRIECNGEKSNLSNRLVFGTKNRPRS